MWSVLNANGVDSLLLLAGVRNLAVAVDDDVASEKTSLASRSGGVVLGVRCSCSRLIPENDMNDGSPTSNTAYRIVAPEELDS